MSCRNRTLRCVNFYKKFRNKRIQVKLNIGHHVCEHKVSERVYSARRLMGSRIIESAAYCNQILLAKVYINRAQNTSVNWIIRLLLSLLCQPKVILLSGGHCNYFRNFYRLHLVRIFFAIFILEICICYQTSTINNIFCVKKT